MRNVLIAGLLVSYITGCASPANQTPEALPTIGETVIDGDRAIAVKEVQTFDGIRVSNQFTEPVDGTVVAVFFGVKNTGRDSGNILFSSFELRDAQGRTYKELDGTTYSLWRSDYSIKDRSSDLFPGETRLDVAAFRTSPDASGFTLIWNGKEEISLN